MRVALAEVGRRGRMDIAFMLRDGRTILRHSYCEVPFKITRLLDAAGDSAHLILMHCTAGLFGGDEVECTIHVERGARVILTQQAATKIHPSPDHRPAIQRTRVSVETGAELHLYMEPVIPFAQSMLRQSTRIDVEPGGRLVFWEGFMTGRVGRGERWQFRELSSETQLLLNGRPVYLDRFALPNGSESSIWSMADHNYFGAGLIVGERARCLAGNLHETLPEAGVDLVANEVVVVRVVAPSGPAFHQSQQAFQLLSSK